MIFSQYAVKNSRGEPRRPPLLSGESLSEKPRQTKSPESAPFQSIQGENNFRVTT